MFLTFHLSGLIYSIIADAGRGAVGKEIGPGLDNLENCYSSLSLGIFVGTFETNE
jgi:hypothetical protein